MAEKHRYTEWDSPEERDKDTGEPDEPLVFMKDPDIRWRIAELIAQAARSGRQ